MTYGKFLYKQGQSTQSAATSEIDEFVFDEDEEDYGGMGEYVAEYDSADEGVGHDDIRHSGAHDSDTDDSRDFDNEDDMPDFRLPDDSEPEHGGDDFSFETADLGAETLESEDK